MATQAELRQNAQRIFERLRMNLLQSLQVGNPRTFAHGNPRSNLTHRSPYSQVNQGLSLPNGRMPNDAEIAAYVQQQPEYRKAVRAIEKSGGGGSGSRGGQVSSDVVNIPQPGPSEAMGLYNNWLAKQQAGFDEAKAANEARYKEGHGELTGVRDFRQDKYQNFGVAAQQDIDERMQETLKNIRAQAASRGLSNSNVPLAFEQRTARDTAREQQRVREMRDSRMADAYAQDTGNLVGFIERREDPYPDMNQALQLGIQLAGSEADRQAQSERLAAMDRMYRGTGGRGRSDVRLPPVPGPQGGVVPYFANGTPLQMANAYFAGRGPRLGVASNRYPTRRTPEEYAAVQAQKPQYLASGGGITSNSHPVGLAANMAGLAYNTAPMLRQGAANVLESAGDNLNAFNEAMLRHGYGLTENHPSFKNNLAGARAVLGGIDNSIGWLWDAARKVSPSKK